MLDCQPSKAIIFTLNRKFLYFDTSAYYFFDTVTLALPITTIHLL